MTTPSHTLDRAPDRVVLCLTTSGRRTGRPVLTVLRANYLLGRLFVVASKAGADRHPDWYLNLVEEPEVSVELEGLRFAAVATPLDPVERDEMFRRICETAPNYAEYQQLTSRVIPVVELVRAEGTPTE